MNSTVITFRFDDDGIIPNNHQLPVLLYLGAAKDKPSQMEALFNYHNWRNSWTNGVYDFHHYHSNSHEVLGVKSGSSTIQVGGELGKAIELHAGDIILLPAGTGHRRLSASQDFQIVGAYPDGMDYNLRRGKESELPLALEEISQVPIPETDPVYGFDGPMRSLWK
ncbi:cupin domain-containing protein [Paenibacillus luteus]|uniref:cupin domain-containing protein n=1 Tax=Paenibacillus luteus TaxID=2545753 RepID=UPI00114342F8|nr:cupin domain-containing protein [Paenibacillus luteus]